MSETQEHDHISLKKRVFMKFQENFALKKNNWRKQTICVRDIEICTMEEIVNQYAAIIRTKNARYQDNTFPTTN